MATTRTTKVLGVQGTKLTLAGKPFFWQGVAFFNALHNPAFNRSADERLAWLRTFKANGISVLRIWCQWNFPPPRTFTDVGPEQSMYTADGDVKDEMFDRLVALIKALDGLDMVLEVAMFSAEKQPYFLPIPAQERATRQLTERLRPFGNLIQQIWSENSTEVMRYFEILKKTDPDRLVTSAPGGSNDLGDDVQNKAYDVLTPHTLRRQAFPFWYIAPAQIEWLLDTYGKPVIDDSPARSGPVMYGGNEGGTKPEYHIEQIRRVRAVGAYHNYLHDMFQYGYGNPLTPPSGIPDPDFSPFHRAVFDYLRDHPTW
jgi:hypothetical protein